MLKYKGMKDIIQAWHLNKCGIGCSEYIGWENEQYAHLILDDKD